MTNNKNNKQLKATFQDGLFKNNTVLISGLVIAPVVVVANTLINAVWLAIAFSAITFLTVLISSFVPRNIVYTIRIILYTLISSVVYVPVAAMLKNVMTDHPSTLGIYLPLLITNSLIVSKGELRFFRTDKSIMILDLISYIIGFDFVVILVGSIREIIAFGTIAERIINRELTFQAFSLPFGGFILLGFLSALVRKLIFATKNKN